LEEQDACAAGSNGRRACVSSARPFPPYCLSFGNANPPLNSQYLALLSPLRRLATLPPATWLLSAAKHSTRSSRRTCRQARPKHSPVGRSSGESTRRRGGRRRRVRLIFFLSLLRHRDLVVSETSFFPSSPPAFLRTDSLTFFYLPPSRVPRVRERPRRSGMGATRRRCRGEV
jgi:hypothetical protein